MGGKCYNYNEKGHYARNCPKARFWDSKYFIKQMLLAKKDEAGIIPSNEQNDFLLADVAQINAYKEDEKQQIIAIKVKQQNVALIKQIEQYKEKVRVLETTKESKTNFHTEFIEADRKAKQLETELQNQFIQDRDKLEFWKKNEMLYN
ncbi:gag-pol polyprotein [Tanacetum coccineum]